LDVDTIEWLEKKLVQSGKAFILVTHDRWFLDTVCTTIIDIEGGTVAKYSGGYSEYLERIAQRQSMAESKERRRESILRVELEWLKRGPKARGGKDKKRKERIKDMVDGRPGAEAVRSEAFRTAKRRLGGKILELASVAKQYGSHPVLNPFTYKLSSGERIGVVGPNGSGKSTLLDLIAGRIEPSAGSLIKGDTVVVGYFDQTGSEADGDRSILEYVQEAAERIGMGDGSELTAEQFLERFGFPRPMQGQAMNTLSGGERRRILLVRLLIAAPNVLLLDEPTNDFDIPTIALLEDFLQSFSGCVISVSHDRAFLEGMADSLWVLDGEGGIEPFVGSYAAWREYRAESQTKPAQKAKTQSPETAKNDAGASGADEAATGKKLSFKEKKELESLLPEIDRLEEEKAELERRFADPTANLAKDGSAFSQATARYAQVGELIHSKTHRWEELAARPD
jgi:ATP-binding cassette subfamily F protein uup